MDAICASRHRRILIIEKDSVLGAGLVLLLAQKAGLEMATTTETGGQQLLAAVRAFRPDLVVLPCAGTPHVRSDQLAILIEASVPRLVCVSSDCNNAHVYDLSQVSLTAVDDLLALIPAA
jgi:DNA-binding NarL/FixJ family response regulator